MVLGGQIFVLSSKWFMAETLARTLQSAGRFKRTAWTFQPFGNETARNKREQSGFSVNRVTTKRSYYVYF